MKDITSPGLAHHWLVIGCMAILCTTGVSGQTPPGPLKFDELTTMATKSRTYKKVEVREVNPAGIKILHEAGAATIPYEELAPAIRKQLGGFDPEKARQHREKVDQAASDQERALDRDLGKLQKEAAPVNAIDGAPLPATAGAPAAAPPKKKKDHGELTARIVGYRDGVKRVEFKVRTNCKASLDVHNVVPDGHTETFEIAENTNFVREVWVFNNYSTELFNSKGERLDKEASRKKTNLDGLTKPTLR